MPDEKNKNEKVSQQPKGDPRDSLVNGCKAASGEYITVKREQLLEALGEK